MEAKEYVALSGLEDAVIGVAIRNGVDVLVYDAYIVDALLISSDCEVTTAEEYWLLNDVQSLGEEAPLFIYIDYELRNDLKAERDESRVVH